MKESNRREKQREKQRVNALKSSIQLGQQIMASRFAICVRVFALAMLMASHSSYSQAQARTTDAKGKRTTVNFEDQLVEGQTQKPELFYLLQQRDASLKRLIKLRENFLPEMRKTAEDVNLKGSGN
jgi:hypothetical protein